MITYQPKLYDDLDTFFTERGLKRRPDGDWWEDSYDYGVWWYDAQGRTYRLTWIGENGRPPGSGGELYAVRLSGPHVRVGAGVTVMSSGADTGRVVFFGRIPPAEGSNQRHSFMDSRDSWPAAAADSLLEGWADVCGTEKSLEWVEYIMREGIGHGHAIAP